MSKIYMMRLVLYITLLIPVCLQSQSIKIEHLKGEVNTYGAELNFIQIDANTAYYTSATEINNYQTAVYKTQLLNDKWQKGKYFALGNSVSESNINITHKEEFYFSLCDEDNLCKIFKNFSTRLNLENNHSNTQFSKDLGKPINIEGYTNTQPYLAKHNNQEVLYFSSNRPGGFGGMDIWLSILDKNGNYGVPINAGSKINSKQDEITPFYNKGHLYFSSNKKEGLGGYDIYKSEGKLNFWKEAINVIQFNSKQDEMYLTLYTENKGYFSSNRKGALYNTDEFCCNDIFVFEMEEKLDSNLTHPSAKYLPLKLYFHNDEPDCCTMSTTTDKTYKDAYISYFQMEEEYKLYNTNLQSFFEDSLKGNFNKLTDIFSFLLDDLKNGKKIVLEIKGYSSPLHNKAYNKNLSKRRIESFVNYLEQFNNYAFKNYLLNGLLKIVELPLGEFTSDVNVSDDPNNKTMSIYGLDAILERRIEIIDIKLVE